MSCLCAALLAIAVASAGLVGMFWVGMYITDVAKSMKQTPDMLPAPPPPPPKSLAELIAERKVGEVKPLSSCQVT